MYYFFGSMIQYVSMGLFWHSLHFEASFFDLKDIMYPLFFRSGTITGWAFRETANGASAILSGIWYRPFLLVFLRWYSLVAGPKRLFIYLSSTSFRRGKARAGRTICLFFSWSGGRPPLLALREPSCHYPECQYLQTFCQRYDRLRLVHKVAPVKIP